MAGGAAGRAGADAGRDRSRLLFSAALFRGVWPQARLARAFLDDFQRHWPTDDDHTYVDFVREGVTGNGAARAGNARWRRLTEERAGGAKSVFQFDVQSSVAKSTHAGIPWLRFTAFARAPVCISGRSRAGTSPPTAPRLLRSIRRCGAAASRPKGARPTSTTPSASPPGSRAPTAMARSRAS